MRALFLFAIIFLVLSATPAQAAYRAGDPCSQLGETRIDETSTNIIACLYKTETDLTRIWKAMTSSSGGGPAEVQCTAAGNAGDPVCINSTTGNSCYYDHSTAAWRCRAPLAGAGETKGMYCMAAGGSGQLTCINSMTGKWCYYDYSTRAWRCRSPSGAFLP